MSDQFTTVAEPTYRDRMAVISLIREYDSIGCHGLARAVESAHYAESFPHSYTEEAVNVSRALIVEVGSGGQYLHHTAQIQELQIEGNWYR